ncbi:transposase [Lewinella sp. IMCC34191]|uniref:transposase n=1 Tax=Lewinella sp. IMCC34191 TaxID=2259172 RepID=UPI000E270BC7|nr:transposase [Lewinella sp. IMCC34191]
MNDYPIPSTPVHITYRLYGSIPNLPMQRLHESHRLALVALNREFPHQLRSTNASARKRHRELNEHQAVRFYLGYDSLLDKAVYGPTFLDTPVAKQIIIDSWQHIAQQRNLQIYAISVMSNHVHIILSSDEANSSWMLKATLRDHKRYTGSMLNRLHKTPGRRVWAEKEYDRAIRRGKFESVLWYVLNNPVKAGITDDPLSWFGNWWAPELHESFIKLRVA